MLKIIKKIVALLFILFLSLAEPALADVISDVPVYSDFYNQDYSDEVHSSPVKSYLYDLGSEFLRVQNNDDQMVFTTFDKNFNPTTSRKLGIDYPVYGGFYKSVDGYYYVFSGQNNYEESQDKVVICVSKYDKNLNKISSAILQDVDTYVPFRSGSLRVAEDKDYLYIRTSHQMYDHGDELNHQSNLTLVYDKNKDDFVFVSDLYGRSSVGYCSHSFNQFIEKDNNGSATRF